MRQFAVQGRQLLGRPMKIKTNMHRHQFKNTECGVYSMYFLMHMLNGRSFDEFVSDGMNDEQMNRYRAHFYNTF